MVTVAMPSQLQRYLAVRLMVMAVTEALAVMVDSLTAVSAVSVETHLQLQDLVYP